jgi:hypothetical protein
MSERKRILITVRTYPVPATKGVEVSCTAGITEGQQWIRIFPIPYRFLQPDRREPVLAIVPGQAIRSAHPAPLNDRPGGLIPPPSQAGTVELPPHDSRHRSRGVPRPGATPAGLPHTRDAGPTAVQSSGVAVAGWARHGQTG